MSRMPLDSELVAAAGNLCYVQVSHGYVRGWETVDGDCQGAGLS